MLGEGGGGRVSAGGRGLLGGLEATDAPSRPYQNIFLCVFLVFFLCLHLFVLIKMHRNVSVRRLIPEVACVVQKEENQVITPCDTTKEIGIMRDTMWTLSKTTSPSKKNAPADGL